MTVSIESPAGTAPVSALARREIRHYLRHPLYWLGVGLLVVVTAMSLIQPTYPASTTLDMIVPAALLGVLGLFVMVSLTRASDAAAETAGATATSESTRTLALAAAVVVPVTTALAWYAAAVTGYVLNPPGPGAVPFGPVSDAYVLAVMFALGVMPAATGPILGLVVARWVPRRGIAAIVAVVVVLVTVLMQGNFEALQRIRLVWPWTYFYGPLGFDTGTEQWVALTGSPFWWIGYLLGLCALGVLLAMAHDPESDRRAVGRAIAVTVVACLVLVTLSIAGGLGQTTPNPLPASTVAAVTG